MLIETKNCVFQHRQLGDEGDGEQTKEVVVRISSLEGNPSLLKEVREKKIKSREEKEELVETEDVVHLGNISDKVRKYNNISILTCIINKRNIIL